MQNEPQTEEYATEELISIFKSNSGKNVSLNSDKAHKNKQKVNITDIRKLTSVLSYVPLLWLIGLLIYPSDRYVQFHVNQGVLLNIVFLTLGMIVNIFNTMLLLISPVMLFLTTLIYILLAMIMLIYMILGIINAYNNSVKTLPAIGKIYVFTK